MLADGPGLPLLPARAYRMTKCRLPVAMIFSADDDERNL